MNKTKELNKETTFRIEKMTFDDSRLLTFMENREREQSEWFDYEYGMLDWDYIKQNILKDSKVLCCLKDEKVRAVCLITDIPESKELDFIPRHIPYSGVIDVLEEVEGSEEVEKIISHLNTHYPNVIVDWQRYGYELEKQGFEKLLFPYESENRSGEFSFFDFEPYVSNNKEEIMDAFYERLEKGLVKSVQVYEYTDDELRVELYGEDHIPSIPCFRGSSEALFEGFSYFTPKDLNSFHRPKDLKFIVAKAIEEHKGELRERIVGVIKTAKYDCSISEYTGINYTDVHRFYRRMGIAKKMYTKLNETLTEHDVLIGSMLSQMGRKVKINEVRKQFVNVCPVFDSTQGYYESRSCKVN